MYLLSYFALLIQLQQVVGFGIKYKSTVDYMEMVQTLHEEQKKS